MSLKNKRVMVTGGAGFIGSHLCEVLLKEEVERLVIVDNFSLGKERNIHDILPIPNVKVYRNSICDMAKMSQIFDDENVDVVFNLAVIPLPASLVDPKTTIDENVIMTSTICELQRKNKFKTLIHTSSSESYGSSIYIDRPMDEYHPTQPTTPYAASKLASDHIALSYMKTFNLDTSIARPFNAYGPRQNELSYAGVIPITIKKILNGEPPVIQGDGLQTRDYTYVEDLAAAFPKIYEKIETRGKVLNLASGKEITIKELIEMIIQVSGYNGEIKYTAPRPGDVRKHLGDITLAMKLINYKPKTSFPVGIRKTFEWYKKLFIGELR